MRLKAMTLLLGIMGTAAAATIPAVNAIGVASHNEIATTGSSIAVTRPNIVPGSCIVVAVTCGDAQTISNVSDGTTTNSTPDKSLHWTAGTQWLALFSFPNHTGGTFTFTATLSGSATFRGIDVIELQGADPTSPLDGTASAQGTSAAPSTGNLSPSPAADGDYIVGFALGASALTKAAAFTDLVNDPTINTSDLEGLAQGAHAAIAATWTMTSGNWGAIAASYKLPATGTIFSDTVTESGTASDAQTAQADFAGARTDALTASDSDTATAVMGVARSDALTASDSETGLASFVVARAELGTVSDSETAVGTYPAARSDSLTATDSQDATTSSGPQVFNVSVSETLTAADAETGPASFVVARAETVTAADADNASGIFAGLRSESLALAENDLVTASFRVAIDELLASLDSSVGDFPPTGATFEMRVGGGPLLTSRISGGGVFTESLRGGVVLTGSLSGGVV